jgi:hypothetical protein
VARTEICGSGLRTWTVALPTLQLTLGPFGPLWGLEIAGHGFDNYIKCNDLSIYVQGALFFAIRRLAIAKQLFI